MLSIEDVVAVLPDLKLALEEGLEDIEEGLEDKEGETVLLTLGFLVTLFEEAAFLAKAGLARARPTMFLIVRETTYDRGLSYSLEFTSFNKKCYSATQTNKFTENLYGKHKEHDGYSTSNLRMSRSKFLEGIIVDMDRKVSEVQHDSLDT